jgi:signal transduction histidine kinase
MLERAHIEPVVAEIAFKRDSGGFPARVEVFTPYEDTRATCIVVTDLSEQRRHEAVSAAEALGRSILDQALDAVVVCDLRGVVVRASASSHALCGCNPLLQPFSDVFPLVGRDRPLDLGEIRRGQALRNAPFEMDQGARQISLLVSAGPVVDAAGAVVACVITMTDVTELRRVEAALKEADARKDEMLAMVVHELRNPVSNISLVADLLNVKPLDARRLAHVRDSLKRGIHQITRLVEDLSDFNRIRLHKLNLRCEVIDLCDVVRHAVESRQALLAERAQNIEVTLAEPPVPVYADDSRLMQVFINLINNANKFTQKGGVIALRMAVDAATRTVAVTVADNGAGIAPGLLPKIFNAFEQGVAAGRQGGIGIGLTLSRRIVELHGGTIDAASEGPGTGSTFTVRLPLH